MREMETTAVVLLLLSVGAWCRGEEKITKVTGSIVTFRASADVQPSEISWLKNEIKIVELEEGKEPDFYPFYNIRDRVDVNLTEKSFILQDVTPVDSGTYKAVLLVNGRLINFFFILLVLDPVCKVSVQNTTVGHNVSLSCSCSSDVAQPSQYEWRNVTHRVSDQQNLTVSMGKEPQTLWCVVRNEVSSSNATVTVPGRVPDERSHIIIIAAVLVPLIVFSIIIWLISNDKYGGLLGLCHSDRQQVATKYSEDPECEEDVKEPGNGADSEDPECEEDVKEPGNGAVQMATRTSASPIESKSRTAMGREDEHGAQDSAQKEEVPKFQNSVHVEGAQDAAQKEEETKFQNSVHVEGAQDSAQKEEETKFQNSVNVEGAQDSAQKEEVPKFQNSVHVEGAQDSAQKEEETKFQNSVHVEGAQDSAPKEEETKIEKNVNMEEAQDSTEIEEEANTKM